MCSQRHQWNEIAARSQLVFHICKWWVYKVFLMRKLYKKQRCPKIWFSLKLLSQNLAALGEKIQAMYFYPCPSAQLSSRFTPVAGSEVGLPWCLQTLHYSPLEEQLISYNLAIWTLSWEKQLLSLSRRLDLSRWEQERRKIQLSAVLHLTPQNSWQYCSRHWWAFTKLKQKGTHFPAAM